MTGFRVHPGGAQRLFEVTPDLTTLGKVIGGGLPVGAYGGRREIMELVAPEGAVYQAGTLSGNPLAMAAGCETLRVVSEAGVWDGIAAMGERLVSGLADAARDAGVPVQTAQTGTMLGLFFTDAPVRSWDDASRADTERFARFHRELRERGVYLPPSQFETWFLSTAHGEEEIDATIAAAREAFRSL
jgi:glutamate-1-semialdehyde 2,1-aminomutase